MRIVSLYRGAKVRLGILLNETILDATTAANTLGTKRAIFETPFLSFVVVKRR
jgi:hypothetical protein